MEDPDTSRTEALHLEPSARAELERCARAAHPLEACGVLVGAGAGSRVQRCRALRNVAAEPRASFELDPRGFMAADEAARAAGLAILGLWHSHPDRPAVPSALDRAAASPGWSYVIASVSARGGVVLRAWRAVGGRLVEQALVHEREPAHPLRKA